MNDIWQFFLGVSEGMRDALSHLNPLPVLLVAVAIGLLQSKPNGYALKALMAVAIVLAFQIFTPVVLGHAQPKWPDLGHIGEIVALFLLYVFAYGMIGVLGSLKGMMKMGAAKSAH